jgi:hypothetical protein
LIMRGKDRVGALTADRYAGQLELVVDRLGQGET